MGEAHDKENRGPVGAWIHKELWKRVKAQAALEGRPTGHVMDDAIRMYLEAEKEQQSGE